MVRVSLRAVVPLAAALVLGGARPARARGVRSPVDLKGPYASLEDYCSTLGRRPARRCAPEPGRWSRSLEIRGARADSPAVRLLRVKGNEAGVPVEYCRIGVQSRDGWYVTTDEEHCQGTFGEMFSVETEALSLTWVEGAPAPTFVLTTRRTQGSTEYEERSDGSRRKIPTGDEARRARVCTIPADAAPRCSGEYLVGCYDGRHRWRETHGSVEQGSLTVARSERATCNSGLRLGTPIRDD
jgi:hypothetical protein